MPPVKGVPARAYVDWEGRAVTESRYTHTSPKAVERMFRTEHPNAFFPGASAFNRKATSDGGQEFDENPLGGPPVMHTTIHPLNSGAVGVWGVRSTFTGMLKGEAEVRAFQDGQHTVVQETTTVRPNLHAIPLAGQMLKVAERVPVFGTMMRVGREAFETAAGAGLAKIHADRVRDNSVPAIARTLGRDGKP